MNVRAELSRRSLFRGKLGGRDDTTGRWHLVDDLAAGSGDVFWDGWADEEGVFVVGDEGAIFQFDGLAWTRMQSPAPVPLHSLWGNARSELWAVGWMGLILKFDGAHWTKVRGCLVDANGKYSGDLENTPLFAVTGAPDGRAWAVGDRGTILHFDGAGWTAETSGTKAHLRCVFRLDDDRVIAAGADGTVLIRDVAGTWDLVPCQVATNFTSCLPLEGGAILLAGGRYYTASNGFRGDLVLYDKGEFRRLFEGAEFSRFRALAADTAGILAVGDAGMIHRIRDQRIDRMESGTRHDLLGIVRLGSGEVLSVGDFGTVLVGDKDALETYAPSVQAGEDVCHWEPLDTGTDRQLWGLWLNPETGDPYACGEEGIVLVQDRGQWEALPPVGDLGVHALAHAPGGGLLAAGQLGEIHHYDGERWRKEYDLLMDVTLLSVWSDGEGNIFAAGDEGLVLNRTEGNWQRMPSGTKSALYGLWGPDAEHLLAVGDFGLVLRWNGTRWDTFNAGTEHFLFDVWGRGLDDVFVVGLSGTIGHFDGRRWNIIPARARNDLLAISGTAETVSAVGAGGIAVVHDGAGWGLDPTGTTAGLRALLAGRDGEYYAAGDGGLILRRDPVVVRSTG